MKKRLTPTGTKLLSISLWLWLVGVTQVNAVEILRMATTTSTENSGLLAVLNPVFEEKFNAKVHVIAVGTGKALKLGENGDVDIIFAHAPEAEQAFVEAGFGVDRTPVMHNTFVIIGEKSDPAAVKTAQSSEDALKKINQRQAPFISRGDDSGTHKKEKKLWLKTGIDPVGAWYVSAGQGMGAVIRMADEKQAYTLTDLGTFIFFQDKVELEILYQGGVELFNPYHIMAVNPERYAHTNYLLAKQYIDFVTGIDGQRIIADYKVKGKQLFFPDKITQRPE